MDRHSGGHHLYIDVGWDGPFEDEVMDVADGNGEFLTPGFDAKDE